MVPEDPGQPAGDTGTRRTTGVEDGPQLRTSSAHGSHPGLRPGPGHAPAGPGRPSTLAPAAVPTTRCASRQRCAREPGHDFRRAGRVTSPDPRPARQGKAPAEPPPQIEAGSRASATVPAGPAPTSGRRGLRAGHRISAEATTGSAGAGAGARHRRARVPAAETRAGAKERNQAGRRAVIKGSWRRCSHDISLVTAWSEPAKAVCLCSVATSSAIRICRIGRAPSRRRSSHRTAAATHPGSRRRLPEVPGEGESPHASRWPRKNIAHLCRHSERWAGPSTAHHSRSVLR
jgi:hypothetical protein